MAKGESVSKGARICEERTEGALREEQEPAVVFDLNQEYADVIANAPEHSFASLGKRGS